MLMDLQDPAGPQIAPVVYSEAEDEDIVKTKKQKRKRGRPRSNFFHDFSHFVDMVKNEISGTDSDASSSVSSDDSDFEFSRLVADTHSLYESLNLDFANIQETFDVSLDLGVVDENPEIPGLPAEVRNVSVGEACKLVLGAGQVPIFVFVLSRLFDPKKSKNSPIWIGEVRTHARRTRCLTNLKCSVVKLLPIALSLNVLMSSICSRFSPSNNLKA